MSINPEWKRSFSELKQQCAGRWPEIVSALAPSLREAIEALSNNPRQHVACPVHGGKKDFCLFRDFQETGGGHCWSPGCGSHPDGFGLIAWANNISYKDIVKEVAEYIDSGNVQPVSFTAPPPKPKVSREVRLAKLWRVWKAAYPITHRSLAAMRYLENRGLSGLQDIPGTLRYHPRLKYWAENDDGKWEVIGIFPAIIALATDVRLKMVTIHRTYLSHDGHKADLGESNRAKKWMPSVFDGATRELGASIKLYQPGPVLGLSEGIENALTAQLVYGIPVWPTMSANILPFVQLPRCVKTVIHFMDNDVSGAGENADKQLRTNMLPQGIQVVSTMPPHDEKNGKGTDWNNVLIQHGIDAFPEIHIPAVKRVIRPR